MRDQVTVSLPSFLKGIVELSRYAKWVERRAIAHRNRDRKRGNESATIADYKAAIHSAVLKNGGLCPYTGDALDWHLIGTYNNDLSRSGRRLYKAGLAKLPTVDHVGDGLGRANFVICGWAVNNAKGDLCLSDFLALCGRVLTYTSTGLDH